MALHFFLLRMMYRRMYAKRAKIWTRRAWKALGNLQMKRAHAYLAAARMATMSSQAPRLRKPLTKHDRVLRFLKRLNDAGALDHFLAGFTR
ncbi:unnamed protein product [Symbiodinium sp. CCMP2592]|nr:unnamed protein product [Symbiodinium sp. CCMP2592]